MESSCGLNSMKTSWVLFSSSDRFSHRALCGILKFGSLKVSFLHGLGIVITDIKYCNGHVIYGEKEHSCSRKGLNR